MATAVRPVQMLGYAFAAQAAFRDRAAVRLRWDALNRAIRRRLNRRWDRLNVLFRRWRDEDL